MKQTLLDKIIMFTLFSIMLVVGAYMYFVIPTRFYSYPIYGRDGQIMQSSILVACEDGGELFIPDEKHCATRDGRYHLEYVAPNVTYQVKK